MAVTIAEIQHLRKNDRSRDDGLQNALTEANGDFDKAMEIIRKKGQAVAANARSRSIEGCVLAKAEGNFAAIMAYNAKPIL